jgi:hypothetical protein
MTEKLQPPPVNRPATQDAQGKEADFSLQWRRWFIDLQKIVEELQSKSHAP